MDLIERLFTNVVLALSAVIWLPTIMAVWKLLVLLLVPPNIEDHMPVAMFDVPPTMAV